MMKLEIKGSWRGRVSALALAGTTVLAGCDFSVTNPGPVNDEFLDNPAAFSSIVNGVTRQLSGALNWIAVDVAVRTRELHATQANEYVGVYVESHLGTVNPDFDAGWTQASDARWIGDNAIERMTEVMGGSASSSATLARAYLWTGYAYRLMGEYFCEVTMDSGPAMPSSDFLETAVQRFTSAIEVGTAAGAADIAMAARAARAAVYVDLGNWDAAVADARMVPTDFEWQVPYYRGGDWRYYNSVYWYSADEPYRSLTVWNTPYESYYMETGDPRTPWMAHPEEEFGTGSLQPWGPVLWYTQEKYDNEEANIDLSDGSEMRLIEAEAMLRGGDVAGAMAQINALRTAAGVAARPTAISLDQAWTYLKRERGIVLWLEGRRLADLKRWRADSTPGALAPEELGLTNGGPDLSNAAVCVGIPNSERDANPNLESL